MDFRKITLNDKEWIIDRLAVDKFYGSEYCFSTIFNWQEQENTMVTAFETFAVLRRGKDKVEYCYFGHGDREKLIAALEEDAAAFGKPLCFYGLMEQEKNRLEELFPGRFEFSEVEESFDYCYSWETLAELKGRKLANKRNHIKKFILDAPDWKYEPMYEDNITDCKQMAESWYERRFAATGEEMCDEKKALFSALDNFREQNLIGGLIRVKGKVEAFTLGYPVSEKAIVVHFEKANPNIPGSYQMINNQYALNSCKSFSIINREDDMGIENLRSSKLSYDPVELLVKYKAVSVK